MNRKRLFGIFVIGSILFSISGCVTTYGPGNPEYAWLNGTWEGPSTTWGNRMRLELTVVNGNEITGRFAWYRRHPTLGTRWFYDGSVWSGKIDGAKINIEVRWHGSGNITNYQFTYHPEDQSLRSSTTYLTQLKADSRT